MAASENRQVRVRPPDQTAAAHQRLLDLLEEPASVLVTGGKGRGKWEEEEVDAMRGRVEERARNKRCEEKKGVGTEGRLLLGSDLLHALLRLHECCLLLLLHGLERHRSGNNLNKG